MLELWNQSIAAVNLPYTILLGLVVFAFAYVEGAANEWLTLGLHDERGFTEAGAALIVADKVADLREGAEAAAAIIDSGKARETLARLVAVSNGRER